MKLITCLSRTAHSVFVTSSKEELDENSVSLVSAGCFINKFKGGERYIRVNLKLTDLD